MSLTKLKSLWKRLWWWCRIALSCRLPEVQRFSDFSQVTVTNEEKMSCTYANFHSRIVRIVRRGIGCLFISVSTTSAAVFPMQLSALSQTICGPTNASSISGNTTLGCKYSLWNHRPPCSCDFSLRPDYADPSEDLLRYLADSLQTNATLTTLEYWSQLLHTVTQSNGVFFRSSSWLLFLFLLLLLLYIFAEYLKSNCILTSLTPCSITVLWSYFLCTALCAY